MIRLMIADDHQIFVDGIKSLLQNEQGIDVVGEALNGKHLLGQIPHLKPDVILLDINMPEMDGLEAAGKIATDHPEIRIIMLTMHERARSAACSASPDAHPAVTIITPASARAPTAITG